MVEASISPGAESALVDKLRTAYLPICNIIWRDLNRVLPPGNSADSRRELVSAILWRFGDYLELTG